MKLFLSVLMLVGMFTASSNAEAKRCSVDLVNGRGRLLETFHARGWDRRDACQQAKRDCRRVKRAGYYRARIQTCEVKPRRGNQRIVHRTCEATLVRARGRRHGGRTMRSFIGSASGRRGTGVKALACERALRQCQTVRSRTRGRGGRCTVERHGAGRYDIGRGNGRVIGGIHGI